MSFLLDTNICSIHLRRPTALAHRFMQHSGRLNVSTIALAEFYVWAERSSNRARVLREIEGFMVDIAVLNFDSHCADVFGSVKAGLLDQGIVVPAMDLLIGVTALVHDLTLVTHNVADFVNIPNLRVIDWLED